MLISSTKTDSPTKNVLFLRFSCPHFWVMSLKLGCIQLTWLQLRRKQQARRIRSVNRAYVNNNNSHQRHSGWNVVMHFSVWNLPFEVVLDAERREKHKKIALTFGSNWLLCGCKVLQQPQWIMRITYVKLPLKWLIRAVVSCNSVIQIIRKLHAKTLEIREICNVWTGRRAISHSLITLKSE